jgi:hypothetical protein
MNKAEDILSMVNDERITDDAWSDVFKHTAIDLLDSCQDIAERNHLFTSLNALDGVFRLRLLEVLLTESDLNRFEYYLTLLDPDNIDLSEIIFDNLRSWELPREQSLKLLQTFDSFKGKSPILDYIMMDFKLKNRL